MNTKTMRPGISVRFFAVVMLATCAFAAAANAQSTMAAKFTLPYEVHWGTNVLPAGDYSISLGSHGDVGLVQSANGKTAFFTTIPIKSDSDKGATALQLMVRGNERRVRSLNLPERGISLTYQPTTSAEREMFAKADQVQAVPVITAGK